MAQVIVTLQLNEKFNHLFAIRLYDIFDTAFAAK